MSFRQFPATDANGDDYVIIEFKDEQTGGSTAASDAHARYELADGRHLVRDGHLFRTSGGELTLST
jgi:hypothetical protein